MKKIKLWLCALLFVQILAVTGLYILSQKKVSFDIEATVIGFDVNTADMLVIEGENNNISLTRSDNQWLLTDTGLPVNQNLLDNFITDLNALKTGWPVAETVASHSRFEVKDDEFKRHVQVYKNGNLVNDLYFGSSPGFKKTQFRNANEKEVYTVALNAVELPISADDWMDKSLLAVEAPTKIKGLDYVLTKSDDEWSFSGLSEALKTTPVKVNFEEFVTIFDTLQVLNVVKEPTDALNTPERIIEVTNAENTWIYKVAFSGDDLYLQRNDYQQTFNIRKEDYDLLSGVNLAILDVRRAKTAEEASESAAIDSAVPIPK